MLGYGFQEFYPAWLPNVRMPAPQAVGELFYKKLAGQTAIFKG